MVTVSNTGNATLLSVTVEGQPAGCASVLAPGDAVNCTVTHTVNQEAFDAWDASGQAVLVEAAVLAVTGPNSDVLSIAGGANVSLVLESRQSVSSTVSVAPSAVVTAGERTKPQDVGKACASCMWLAHQGLLAHKRAALMKLHVV